MNTPTLPALRRPSASASIALLLALLTCTQAHAVQRCRIDGRLVLQATPCPGDTALPAVPGAKLLAEATGLAPKRPLAEALRERDADNRARASRHDDEIDGASILPARMGAL